MWHALNSGDEKFNLGNKVVGFFAEEISPFAGLPRWDAEMQAQLLHQLPLDRTFSTMVAAPIAFTNNWDNLFSITLNQLICPVLLPPIPLKIDCVRLTEVHVPAMLALTEITKPGPFLSQTIAFGNYIGVFEQNKLVAMAGERLHLNGFTEISAVCTDPEFTGKGYAAFLVSKLVEQIIQSGNIPFLHVRQDNLRAIEMYKRLGFLQRSEMYFGVFKRVEQLN